MSGEADCFESSSSATMSWLPNGHCMLGVSGVGLGTRIVAGAQRLPTKSGQKRTLHMETVFED